MDVYLLYSAVVYELYVLFLEVLAATIIIPHHLVLSDE